MSEHFRRITGARLTAKSVQALPAWGYGNCVTWPRAIYYNGKTYFGNVCQDKSPLTVASFTNASRTTSAPYALLSPDAGDGNVHVSPSLILRDSDKKIIVGYADNIQPTGYSYTYTSTNAEDATAFGASAKVDATGRWGPTYPILVQLTSVTNDPIYYFVRWYSSGTFYTGYYKSTDGGATWGSWVNLWKPVSTSSQYHIIVSDFASRVDFYVTTTNRAAGTPSAVYHAYLDGTTENLYKSDGTLIGAATGGPYFATSGTLVQDTGLGSAWPASAGYSGGKPHCSLGINIDNASTDVRTRVARWTGSAWQVDTVADAGGVFADVFESGSAVSWTSPDRIFMGKKVGSFFEMYVYDSPDSGTSWDPTAITVGSDKDNVLPFVPKDAAAGCEVLWTQGDLASATAYNMRVMSYG